MKFFTIQCPITDRKFKYKRTPMGCKTSSAIFHNCASRLLFKGMDPKSYSNYIDDNTVFANTFPEILSLLRKLVTNFRNSGFELNLKKCQFVVPSIKLFGYDVSANGVVPDKERVEAIKKIQCPRTVKQLQKSLGSLNYYRNSIKSYSKISAPLYDRLKGKEKLVVDEKLQANWNSLLEAFQNYVQLNRPNTTGKFILETDASGSALGGVLKQVQEGEEKIIAVYSYKLNKNELFYESSARELFAICKSIKKFSKYLVLREFLIRSDSRVNVILLSTKIANVDVSDARKSPVYRHLMYVSQFEFTIEHISGTAPPFLIVDLLSRLNASSTDYLSLGKSMRKPILFLKNLRNEIQSLSIAAVRLTKTIEPSVIVEVVKNAQKDSKQMELIKERQLDKRTARTTISIKGDLVYYNDKILVPELAVNEVLESLHTHGEGAGVLSKKMDEIKITIERQLCRVMEYLRQCETCMQSMPDRGRKAINHTVNNPNHVNHKMNIDIMSFGHLKVLIACDAYSKYIKYRIMKDETAETVTEAFLTILLEWGPPQIVTSDNGACFVASQFREAMALMNINHVRIAPRNLRGNGAAERSVGLIQEKLRCHQPRKDGTDLSLALAIAVFELNSRILRECKYSPSELCFHFTGHWYGQLPELSETALKRNSPQMQKLRKMITEVEKQMVNARMQKLKAIESKSSCKLKQGDIVKLRRQQKVGELKKLTRPFSTKNYRVLKVFHHTQSVLLEEVVESTVLRPNRCKSHIRHCKRVGITEQKDQSDENSGEVVEQVEQENNEVATTVKESPYNLRNRRK